MSDLKVITKQEDDNNKEKSRFEQPRTHARTKKGVNENGDVKKKWKIADTYLGEKDDSSKMDLEQQQFGLRFIKIGVSCFSNLFRI